MLDENLPTYRFRQSSDNQLNSLLYFTHNGSEPSADFLMKRPPPSTSPNQYALGLFDLKYASVLYAEVLVKPEWQQPTLSAAEVRANGGNPVATPLIPNSFTIDLYNPDQSVQIKYQSGSWSKDVWEFEVPQRSFKQPTGSQIDQDGPETTISDLIPKVNFRWKRDSRMSRDMTCYMSGKTVGGQKSKEPDITIALFKAGKPGGSVSIYEPNMARVDVEDRKGLEVTLLLSAEVIRALYLSPKPDLFNTAGIPPPPTTTKDTATPVATGSGAAMAGAIGNMQPAPQPPRPANQSTEKDPDAVARSEIDAEKRRRQAMIEEQNARERRVQQEQEEIKRMLEREEREEADRRRHANEERERKVAKETEKLLKQYGPQPALPPRPGGPAQMSGGAAGWHTSNQGPAAPAQPPRRPRSVDPPRANVHFAQQETSPTQQPQYSGGPAHGGGGGGVSSAAKKKFNNFLSTSSPYSGPGAASMSTFFGKPSEEDKRNKVKKKRSTHF
ncbi:uncharacterized protein J7T54_007872 [Emericellopsis cladophorae]|uniref:Uncharacterized protein n=1 Tax=Emericellopsis cladophorae TaxID=2686198 RepID=A0A9P9Y766_9HYPO|nr:uncharacterized protein J7T54_007872 [Emericellopsis cladophorae]KAI6784779.1 hypothetical protein J7T54_007872 [Emericellopsis cladophorae]